MFERTADDHRYSNLHRHVDRVEIKTLTHWTEY